MFALRSRSENAIRVILITVILFSALGPTVAAKANSFSGENEVIEPISDTFHFGQISSRATVVQQQARNSNTLSHLHVSYLETPPAVTETPTVTPAATDSETLAVTPSATSSQDVETDLIADPSETFSPAPDTPVVESFPVEQSKTESLAASKIAPLLAFDLSVSPEQAAPGAEVTFTAQIKNYGQTDATDLQFSDTLPAEFGNQQDGLTGFNFDPQTRLLRWTGTKESLPAGQTITLQYSVYLDSSISDEIEITDTATFSADGLTVPLQDQATLTVLSAEKQFTHLGMQGGKATGLNGHIQVQVPPGVLETTDGVLIKEIKKNDEKSQKGTSLFFSLERRSSEQQISSSQGDIIHSLDMKEAKFDRPLEIAISFDGFADLASVGADMNPYLITLDEASSTWVRVPLKTIDPATNIITAEITHFSTWGAGIGPSFPQNGANVPLFDKAQPDLFAGRARYSIPIWTPPGRNGMAPSLALSYSSGVVDGVLGDVQASWVGMGWSIDSIEIVRKIINGVCDTGCGGGMYGYENQFQLVFKGASYELVPDNMNPKRYHTKSESFLYIERHNDILGNNDPAPSNTTHEWWEVVEKDGTRWKLGTTNNSEQLAAMKGYSYPLVGAWQMLGYAGSATNVVASRWRVDQVTDRFDNEMNFTYTEENRTVQVEGVSITYDQASYLATIAYTKYKDSVPAGYSIVFVTEPRQGSDIPASPNDWDNWDTSRLDRIDVKYGNDVVRTYDLGYNVRSYSDDGKSWQTTTLTSVAVSGGGTNAPTITFDYVDGANRANCGAGCQEWAYPRLQSIANGLGGTSAFTYVNDGRAFTSWYNWRVEATDIRDGVSPEPMRTTYNYITPCYKDYNYMDVDALQILAPVRPGTYDDTDSNWVYSGAWANYSGSGPYNNTLHYTNSVGDEAELTFTGTQFILSYTKDFNRGSIDVYIDDGKVSTINAYSATYAYQQTYTSSILTSGTHKVRFVHAGGSGTYIDIDAIQILGTPVAVPAGTYDDTNSNWVYSGAWSNYVGGGPYNTTLHFTSTVGNYAELTFTGTQFTLLFMKDSNRGSIDVYVDGNKISTINAYSATYAYQQTYTSPIYTSGNHTVRLVHAGTGAYVDIDAIQIYNGTPSAVLTGTYDDANPAWTYSSNWSTYSGSGPYNSTLHFTSTVGSYAELTFTGTRFILSFTKDFNRGSIDVYLDGTAESNRITTINTYSSAYAFQQTYVSPIFANGSHTVRLVHAGGSGTYIDIDAIQILAPVTAGTYDDSNSSWVYSGAWSYYSGSGPYNNTLRFTTTAENFAEFTFTGTRFKFFYTKDFNRGLMDVYVGGSKVATINGYSAAYAFQQVYTSPPLAEGEHTVRFQFNGSDLCSVGNTGELVGYSQVTATTMDFNGQTPLAKSVHKFHTDPQRAGREYEVQQQDAAGTTTLSKTVTTYTTATTGLPTDGYFTYASAVDEYVYSTSLDRISHTEYVYDTTTTGNLITEKDFDGGDTPHLYRQIDYDYVTNTSPSVWILDTVWRRTLKDASSTILSEQRYGYNGNLPGVGSPTTAKPDLSRQVSGTQTIDTKYHYDDYGNLTETQKFKAPGSTTSQPTGDSISFLTNYHDDLSTTADDDLFTYPTSSTNPLNQTTRTHYDYSRGWPLTVTDPNNNTTTTAYDGLGRVTSIRYPNYTEANGYTKANIEYIYPAPSGSPLAVSAPFAVKMKILDESPDPDIQRSSWQIMDGLGRVIQAQDPYEASGTTNNLVLTDTSYNALGLPQNQGLPRTMFVSNPVGAYQAPTWSSVPHTTTSYDALNRVTQVDYPDGSRETTDYSAGLSTKFIDRNNHQKIQEKDAFGRLWKVYEYTGSASPYTRYATTTYGYDERDLLRTVADASTPVNVTTINYDGFGRKIEMNDPDLGNWRYQYNALGNLTVQIDAKRQAINLYYDNLSRLVGKTYTAGPVDPDTYQLPDDPGENCSSDCYIENYYYDEGINGIGRRTRMSDSNSTTSWVYNALGQVTSETHNIENTDYVINTNYDAFGRPLSQTIPSQGSTEMLNYGYSAMGALSGLSNGTTNYVSQIHYNASGQVTDQLLGNNLLQQSCYDTNTLRLTKLRVYSGTLLGCETDPASPRLDLRYLLYQPNGNISQIKDTTHNETLTYTYDELDRLDTVSGPYSHNYDYNEIGNITQKNTTTYTYGDPDHKHAVTSLSTGESYQYDANGNMTCRVENGNTYKQDYNAENQLSAVYKMNGTCATGTIQETTRFLYDGDGSLVKKINPGGSKTLYIAGIYEVDKALDDTPTQTRTYYPAGGAMRVGSTLYFVLKDHLGSASVVMNATGTTVVGEQRYYPFGETRFTSGTMQTDKLFTGQREITGLGIYYYQARFYSPYINHFLSPDRIVPSYANPQSLNRYSYVFNNPLRYTDPSGHRACESKKGTECDWKTPYLWDRAESIVKRLGGKNDLEAMAKIVDAGARVYKDFDTLLPALSTVFVGVEKSGPGTLLAAAQMANKDGCAGVGREPHDCPGATNYFRDKGFHPDFQDTHNQIFHLWGYIANTAVPGNSFGGGIGLLEATGANVVHEIGQSILRRPDNGWGTSWQDFELSGQGMNIGALITTGSIQPSELADVIRNTVGPQGAGSGGEFQMLNGFFGPLAGQFLP